jgi:hypothetical protein
VAGLGQPHGAGQPDDTRSDHDDAHGTQPVARVSAAEVGNRVLMATLSQRRKTNARRNAKRRGKKPGAYDNLRAAGKPMKRTSGRTKKGSRSKAAQRSRNRGKRSS